ncbi:MAG: permease prefix domain 1-containing protein [Clostridium sp.]|uniref:permease prefix domain 1-containing protein n=1 Tax=Clostridium sp. TaxID=1506 RepID=UPI00306E2361
MDTIINYVENMFKTLPRTKELKNLKSEILNNMEDKYSELKLDGKSENEAIGIVISEFGNIDEIIREFGIELGNDKLEDDLVSIDMEQAREYLRINKKANFIVSIGVALCMTGVAILVFLIQLIEDGKIFSTLGEDKATFVPVTILLIFVGVAVALFIFVGVTMENYQYIDKGAFKLDSTVRIFLKEEMDSMKQNKTIGVIVGVSLCILSPIILFIGGTFGDSGYVYGSSILIMVIALAVYIFINIGGSTERYKKLLQQAEYSIEARKGDKFIGGVASVIWPLATAVFLIWGFIYDGWSISWIVYPVTGIIFGIFCSIYKSIKGIEVN